MKESIQKKAMARAAADVKSDTTQRKEAQPLQLMPEEEEVQMKADDQIQMQEEEELPG